MKQLVFFDSWSFETKKSDLEREATVLNLFIADVKRIALNVEINPEIIRKLVNSSGQVNFNELNNLVLQSALNGNPPIAALNLSTDKSRELLTLVEYSGRNFQMTVAAELIHSYTEFWTIKNGIVCILPGLTEHLRSECSYFAENQIECDRLEQINTILSAMKKLRELSATPEYFSMFKTPFIESFSGEVMPNINLIKFGKL